MTLPEGVGVVGFLFVCWVLVVAYRVRASRTRRRGPRLTTIRDPKQEPRWLE
jgi:hypothetical protein